VKRHKLITLLLALWINLLLLTGMAFGCNLTDAEAITSASNFCKTMGISFPKDPWVLRVNSSSGYDNSETKEIAYGERGDFKGFISVSCDDKEVYSYINFDLRNIVRKKYKISSVTTEPRNWPSFLSESKAKKIVFSIANKIGLPPDVKFIQFVLDKESGYWGAYWHRQYNGYLYEKDRIRIEIMAVDGEFYSYSKIYHGSPCPTDVKVKKENAIEEGWQQIYRLFKEVNWNMEKPGYEIQSTELKIIQPNTLDGQITTYHNTESRLAWVVVYGLKTKPDRSKLAKVAYLQRITIKIDAATKKFIGGDFTQ